jgi:galactokinase/mevalonate kinase-like predicted kinase
MTNYFKLAAHITDPHLREADEEWERKCREGEERYEKIQEKLKELKSDIGTFREALTESGYLSDDLIQPAWQAYRAGDMTSLGRYMKDLIDKYYQAMTEDLVD